MIRYWREWRAWVDAKKAEREEALAVRVRQMVDSMKAPESPYNVYAIIDTVRRHDRAGL